MKKLIIATGIILICLTYSCKELHNDATKASGNDFIKKNALIYKALETGDVSKLDDVIAKDAIDHGMGGTQDVVGADSIKKMLGSMHTMFKNLKMEIISASSDSLYSFEMVRMTAEATSPASGMPVGTKMDALSVDVVKWKDGKAIEHWSFMDSRDAAKMMAPPPPPAKPKM